MIKPRRRFLSVDLASVWRYRDLIWMFFRRDFIAFYKQTVLGPMWYLIQPSLTALTYYVVFGRIANLSTNGLPPFLFYMSGIVLWTYFAVCLTNNSEVFSKNAALFGKVYFPRLVVPISVVMSGMTAFAIQFALLILVSLGYVFAGNGVDLPGLSFLVVPLLVVYVAALGMGVGLVVSALTVRFRDLAFAAGFVTQLWMYASPVVYPFQQIPSKYHGFFHVNPMTAPIETLRHVMFGTPDVSMALWLSNLAVTAGFLILGVLLFSRAESNAMDTV
ncbi:MAG: ABC transporter permease [Burkholderiales bacterium]|nr:ABC transporter permease [Burkholderiales bacterium]